MSYLQRQSPSPSSSTEFGRLYPQCSLGMLKNLSVSVAGVGKSLDLTVKLENRNLGRAVKADSNTGWTNAPAGISHHPAASPETPLVAAGTTRVENQGAYPGQTDLTTVGMSAQVEVDTSLGSLLGQLGRMNQKDVESVPFGLLQSAWQVVTSVVVRVIEAHETKARPVVLDLPNIVKQHLDT